MAIVAWVIIIITLASYFDHLMTGKDRYSSVSEISFYQDHDFNQITIKQNEYKQYIIPGHINDHPVNFLFDTGASIVTIPEHMAKKMQLQKKAKGTAETAGGRVTIWYTIVPTLTIDPTLVLRNVRVGINPNMDADVVLLGMNVLEQIDFSQSDQHLTFKQKKTQ
jgi:aspartyl protease family protein